VHTQFFGNLDVIIIGDFYQVQPVHDAGIFKINMNNIDNLMPNFWMEKIKCYELKQIMHQSDEQYHGCIWHGLSTILVGSVVQGKLCSSSCGNERKIWIFQATICGQV